MRSSLINFSRAYEYAKTKAFFERSAALEPLPDPRSNLTTLNTSNRDGFVLVSEPAGKAAQRYRDIVDEIMARTWIRKRMLVTSPTCGEGKTITSVNLALTLAEKGHSVFLAELTLMRPRYRFVFGSPSTMLGVESALRGEASPEQITFQLGDTRIGVASIATPRPNNDLLKEEENLDRLLKFGEAACDWSILDVPPLHECPAVKELASQAGPVVMVARSCKTKLEVFRRAALTLGNDLDYVILNDIAS